MGYFKTDSNAKGRGPKKYDFFSSLLLLRGLTPLLSSPADNLYFRPIFGGETESMIDKTNFTLGPIKKS